LVETIECMRCKEARPRLERAPFRSELGERILAEICTGCWADWLQHQTLLINHYGLDPRDAKAREFLYAQVESVLLGGGDGEQIDTSKQGQIQWGGPAPES
jgi:Fe-S cluster biosynthesis and repair protein YggX